MSSSIYRDFRHPSPDELHKLMENARRERSIALAQLFGFGSRVRNRKLEDEQPSTVPAREIACIKPA